MVRASDCGPEGRRFDPDIPPHQQMGAKRDERGLVPTVRSRYPTPLTWVKKDIIRGYSTAVSMQVFQT